MFVLNFLEKYSRIVKSFLVVSGGVASSQVINLLVTPFLTRIFNPTEYGSFSVFSAVFQVFFPLAALSLPLALPLPKDNSEAVLIARLSVLIAFLVSAVLVVLMFVLVSLNIYPESFLILPFGVFFYGLYQISHNFCIRNSAYKIIAKVAIILALFSSILKVAIGLIYPQAFTLQSILIINYLLGSYLYCRFLFGMRFESMVLMVSKDWLANSCTGLKRVFKRYISFPLYRSPQAFLNALSQGMPILIIGFYFGPEYSAYFALSRAVFALPINIVGQAISDIFFSELSGKGSEGEHVHPALWRATLLLFLVGFIPFLLMYYLVPLVFPVVFGEAWQGAGEFTQLLIFWYFFGLVNKPVISSISLLGLNKFFLKYELSSFAIRLIIINFGCVVTEDASLTVLLYSLVGALLNVYLIWQVLLISRSIYVKSTFIR